MIHLPNIKRKTKLKTFKRKTAMGEYKSYYLKFGFYGLKALNSGILNYKHLELLYKFLSKRLKKVGKFWFRINVQYQLTEKPKQTRMGKGKGKLSSWVCEVKRGRVLFELDYKIPEVLAFKILEKCKFFLPFKTKVIIKKY